MNDRRVFSREFSDRPAQDFYRKGTRVNNHSINDLRSRARRRLPKMVFDFLEGGALDEHTLRRNEHAFSDRLLRQRVLFDAVNPDTSTSALGQSFDIPLIVSPMGLLTLCHPSADVAVARAAAAAGSAFVHSPWSGCSLEEVTDAAPGRTWAQIAFWNDTSETARHVDRARALGIDTLVIAGDVAVSSKRDRDLRHGTAMPPHPPLRDVADVALHPGWLLRWMFGRPMTFGTYQVNGRRMRMREMEPWMHANENPSATWETFAELRANWNGRILVKGVMSSADAELAMQHGADGVFVSNHGARQFDQQPATIEVVSRIAETVEGRCAVILDSGVRRGSDIAQALALGADLVSAGRPFGFGLAAAGETGVSQAFEMLKDELETVMGFVGASTIAELDQQIFATDTDGAR